MVEAVGVAQISVIFGGDDGANQTEFFALNLLYVWFTKA
jgi:hypothetical protein